MTETTAATDFRSQLLLDRDLYATGDADGFYAWLRANEPVFRDPSGMWALTKYEDVKLAERTPKSSVRRDERRQLSCTKISAWLNRPSAYGLAVDSV